MKSLSIRQPWPYCMTDLNHDPKRTENRTWKPPEYIIGQRIAIHASKQFDGVDGRIGASELAGFKLSTKKDAMPLGAIVATAVVAGYVQCLPNGRFKLFGDVGQGYDPIQDKWLYGPYGWRLADMRKLVIPVPCNGRLGLWNIPKDVLTKVEEAYLVMRNRQDGRYEMEKLQ